MEKRVRVNKVPTSKLVYYRVYKDESPFTKSTIDEELDRRSYVTLDHPINIQSILGSYTTPHKGLATLRPEFINVAIEENKIMRRGCGLENYAFDSDRNIFDTMRIILNSGAISGPSDKPTLSNEFNSILTWSELVLFYSVAKRMLKVTRNHLHALRNLKAKLHSDIIYSRELYPKKIIDQFLDVEDLENWILSFQNFFRDVLKRIKEDICIDNMMKYPINREELAETPTPLRLNRLTSTLIPNDYYESIWDHLLLDMAILKEKGLSLESAPSELATSLNILKSKNADFAEDYKKFTLIPSSRSTQ